MSEQSQVVHIMIRVSRLAAAARMLFDDNTKLWWDGPSAIVDDYLLEISEQQAR